MELGARIRAFRKERELSLEQLSQKSGVALATLSRLENGKGSGTFKTHQKIVEALEIPITDLYQDFEQPEEEAVVVESEEAESFAYDDKASAIMLTTHVSSKRMLPQLLILQVGGKTVLEQYQKEAERWVFGLEGEMEVKVGEKSHLVSKGGTLYFKASLPHQFFNKGAATAKSILVTSPVVL